jgi:pyrimidine operon attenuation protein/uracil phosphoribosyltransferase
VTKPETGMTHVQLIDAQQMYRTLMRMAHEIVEKHGDVNALGLVGIQTRGVPLAKRTAANVLAVCGLEPPVGELDITFYRDDLGTRLDQPEVKSTHFGFDLTDRDLVIVDDVLFTGRTVRAALDAIMDFGRPRRIMLAVLVDRGHRELPIRADFVGKNVPTMRAEDVQVRVLEVDGVDEIVLLKPAGAPDEENLASPESQKEAP